MGQGYNPRNCPCLQPFVTRLQKPSKAQKPYAHSNAFVFSCVFSLENKLEDK